MKYVAAAALVVASSGALAGFDADFTGLYGRNNSIRVDTTGHGGTLNQTFNAGHFQFVYTDMGGDRGLGQFSGGSFATFCIELQSVAPGSSSYDIDTINNAPNPNSGGGQGPYDNADAAELSAVMAAAVSLGWINADLSATGTLTKDQAAAIQGMVWKVVFDNAVVTAETANVAAQMAILEAEYNSNPSGSISHLRAMISADSQDQLFIVPLPTAALAGLMTLAGIGGIKRLRRN
jgi:hypothetical protein